MRALKENEIYVLMQHEAHESGSLIATSFSFDKIKSVFDEKSKSILDQLGQRIYILSDAVVKLRDDEDRYEIYDDTTMFEICIEDII